MLVIVSVILGLIFFLDKYVSLLCCFWVYFIWEFLLVLGFTFVCVVNLGFDLVFVRFFLFCSYGSFVFLGLAFVRLFIVCCLVLVFRLWRYFVFVFVFYFCQDLFFSIGCFQFSFFGFFIWYVVLYCVFGVFVVIVGFCFVLVQQFRQKCFGILGREFDGKNFLVVLGWLFQVIDKMQFLRL